MGSGVAVSSRVPAIVRQWEETVGDSVDNRTPQGRARAEHVARAFARWFLTSSLPPPVVAIYEWLAAAQKEPRWRYGRCTRAMLHRVVRAALEVLRYERSADVDRVDPHHGRRMSGVELGRWLQELHACRAPQVDDAQRLWDVYTQEWNQGTCTATVRTRREKLRRWRKYAGFHKKGDRNFPTEGKNQNPFCFMRSLGSM